MSGIVKRIKNILAPGVGLDKKANLDYHIALGVLLWVVARADGKFLPEVAQITWSGRVGRQRGQRVVYVTERAVLELRDEGPTVVEIAPGVDLQRDVLDRVGIPLVVADDLRLMDERLFRPEPMGLELGAPRRPLPIVEELSR